MVNGWSHIHSTISLERLTFPRLPIAAPLPYILSRLLVMARPAQALQVAVVEDGAAIVDRQNVVDQHGRRGATCLAAHPAQWLGCQMHRADPLPARIIATLTRRPTPLVMLGSGRTPQRAAHAAHASLHQASAARPPTRRR